MLESGPHYDPSKLKPFSLDSGKSASGQTDSRDAVTTVFDLPRRFWDTPALRMSPAEMDAIQVCCFFRYFLATRSLSLFHFLFHFLSPSLSLSLSLFLSRSYLHVYLQSGGASMMD